MARDITLSVSLCKGSDDRIFLLAGAIYADESTITVDGNTSFYNNSVEGETISTLTLCVGITVSTTVLQAVLILIVLDEEHGRFCGRRAWL